MATDTSYTPAPNVPATVAPFRAWRDLQLVVAGEPMPVTIMRLRFAVGRSKTKADITGCGRKMKGGFCLFCKLFAVTIRAFSFQPVIMGKKKPSKTPDNTIARNKSARFEYFIEETLEVGIVLEGWEVKALREKKVQINESYVFVKNGELWLSGVHITPLTSASTHVKPDPTRIRKLLAHRNEIDRISGQVERKGFTLIALSMYWSRGRAKVSIGLAKGKKLHDKRATQKDRDWSRDKARMLKSK